ncbi:hypothetical protein M8818_002295 [Zalaria obscura]|uniref:Uncharacterized protein n=1 Tax=Zalaria obscura TaxID=2024903 RepID=A0ACC3SHS6_9PEZI
MNGFSREGSPSVEPLALNSSNWRPTPGPRQFSYSSYNGQPSPAPLSVGKRSFSSGTPTTHHAPYYSNDAVSKHLLVETALYDSRTFEVLSIGEVDALKQENEQIETRIEAARRKLALESKVRDAAQSLHRLYSTKGRPESRGSPTKQRKPSLLGSAGRSSSAGHKPDEMMNQAGSELETSEKKLDELAKILTGLENRRQYIAGRLLRHTAAVLQAAHMEQPPPPPEKDYAGSGLGLSRAMTPNDLMSFAERPRDYDDSIYSTDTGFAPAGLRVQKQRMSSIMDRMMRDTAATPSAPSVAPQDQRFKDVQHRLEHMNGQLRSLLSQAKRARSSSVDSRPDDVMSSYSDDDIDLPTRVDSQLEHMEKTFQSLVQEQKIMKESHEQALNSSQHDVHAIEGRLEGVNNQLFTLLSTSEALSSTESSPPPEISGHGAQDQINYLEDSLMSLERALQDRSDEASQAASLRAKAAASAEKADQYETVLLGLWEIISTSRASNDDTDDTPRESFSLQAFNTRVQHIFDRAAHLDDQVDILRRQIAQQRELADRAAPDPEQADAKQELEALRTEHVALQDELTQLVARREVESQQLQSSNAELMTELDRLKEKVDEHAAAREKSLGLSRELEDLATRHEEATTELEDHRNRAASLEDRIADLETLLEEEKDEARIAGAEAQAKDREIESLKEHLETEKHRLEAEVVRLTTDLTVAKADLDAAYGSRAERAKEVAMNPEIQDRLARLETLDADLAALHAENAAMATRTAELDAAHTAAESRAASLEAELATLRTARDADGSDKRAAVLEAELRDMADELQSLTRESVEVEKEREGLEATVDGLRERCEVLEAQLSDEKVRWLGMKSPSLVGGETGRDREMTSTMVLRTEFKKMMRETRQEGLRLLRLEQEERRRLEGVVRSLRREGVGSRGGLAGKLMG